MTLDDNIYFDISRHMDKEKLMLSFAALAQRTRLDVFRLLVKAWPEGLLAGDIARHLAVPHNTMSSHLAILLRAGLVTAERSSRTITYRADLDQVRKATRFLLRDCCGGKPELCAPVIEDLKPCCAPPTKKAKTHA